MLRVRRRKGGLDGGRFGLNLGPISLRPSFSLRVPKIVGESMAIGQTWGQSLGPEINRRVEAILKKEGIEIPRK
jgi:hypothetical protein